MTVNLVAPFVWADTVDFSTTLGSVPPGFVTFVATLSVPSGLVFAGDPVLIAATGTNSSDGLFASVNLTLNSVQFFDLSSVLVKTLGPANAKRTWNTPVSTGVPTTWGAIYADYNAAYGLGGTFKMQVEVIGSPTTLSGTFIAALADVVGSSSSRLVTTTLGLNAGETSTTLTIPTPPTTVQANIGFSSGDGSGGPITFVTSSPPVTTDVVTTTSHSIAQTLCSLAPVDDTNIMTISNIPAFVSQGMKVWFSFRPPLVTAAHKSFAALIGD